MVLTRLRNKKRPPPLTIVDNKEPREERAALNKLTIITLIANFFLGSVTSDLLPFQAHQLLFMKEVSSAWLSATESPLT